MKRRRRFEAIIEILGVISINGACVLHWQLCHGERFKGQNDVSYIKHRFCYVWCREMRIEPKWCAETLLLGRLQIKYWQGGRNSVLQNTYLQYKQ